MNKETLISRFAANHFEFTELIRSLSADERLYSYNGKWNALQQVQHLVLVLTPLDFVLASKEKIIERFGTGHRTVMTYDELVSFYTNGLAEGGKAPGRFLPGEPAPESMDEMLDAIRVLVTHTGQQLRDYTEEELDTLILPHPFLGNLFIREMFYLMIYHPLHHARQVKEHLKNYH